MVSVGVSSAEDLPAFWAKSMTNDPATNYYVAQSMKPLASADAQILRVYMLAMIAGKFCSGASVNKAGIDAYLLMVNATLKEETYNDAAFLADDSFKYFDYRALAHLCAGSDYLFGPEGHLAAGLVRSGDGKPRMLRDPKNQFIRLPPLARK